MIFSLFTLLSIFVRRFAVSFVLFMSFFASTAALASSTLILGVTQSPISPELHSQIEAIGGEVSKCYKRARFCLVEFPSQAALPVDALRTLSGVRYVEEDRLMHVSPRTIPQYKEGMGNDGDGTTECPDLWDLDAVHAPQAWAIADGSYAPVIAIQDTGFLLSHEELNGRISGQYDYGNGDTVPEVEWDAGIPDHGTFIAAILVGDPDNGKGRSGLAPYGRVNLQKIADSDGALFFSYAVAAMADLADGDLGVRVLNYSIAGPAATDSFRDAVSALEDAGILLVTAAGNCGVANCAEANNDVNPMFPGSYTFEHIVTVTASTQDGGVNSFSHYGATSVDLAAPGVDLCSAGAWADDNYYTAGGTSYATPLVAAAVALVFVAHPQITTTEAARVLRVSAAKSAAWAGKTRSGGILDAEAALKTAIPRFSLPGAEAIEGDAEIMMMVENVGAEGEVCLVLSHPESIAIDFVRDFVTDFCWTMSYAAPGESITLIDAGTVQANAQAVTVACGPVAAHSVAALKLSTRGLEMGNWTVSARIVMSSAGADYLNAPWNAGLADATGYLAWDFEWQVRALSTQSRAECEERVEPEPCPECDVCEVCDEPCPDVPVCDVCEPASECDCLEPAPAESGGCNAGGSSGFFLSLLPLIFFWRRPGKYARL